MAEQFGRRARAGAGGPDVRLRVVQALAPLVDVQGGDVVGGAGGLVVISGMAYAENRLSHGHWRRLLARPLPSQRERAANKDRR